MSGKVNAYQLFSRYIRDYRPDLLMDEDVPLNARQTLIRLGELWHGIVGIKWRKENGFPEPKQQGSRSNSY